MKTTTEPLIENLVAKVRELAADRPDSVYQPVISDLPEARYYKCSYLGGTCSDGTVGCLVGQALLEIGFAAEQLRPVDLFGIEEALENLLAYELTQSEYQQVHWLESVQNAQDNGRPWHEAIEIGDREKPL